MCLFMGFHSSAGCDFIIICLLCAAVYTQTSLQLTRESAVMPEFYIFSSLSCVLLLSFGSCMCCFCSWWLFFLQFIYRQLVQQLVLDIFCAIETAENNI